MSDVDGEVLRRHLITIATSSYDDPRWKPLDVAGEVDQIRHWLCHDDLGGRRFSPAFPELADDPSEDQIRALRRLPVDGRWTEADAVVVYITGHGESADDTHYLILKETKSAMLSATALRTADVISWLTLTAADHAVIIIDACYAGKVAADVLRLDHGTNHDRNRRWLVLPSATRDQQAVVGALTRAIGAFLDDLRSERGGRYGHGPYIDVGVFVEDVGRKLAEAGYDQDLLPLYGRQLRGPHVCLPNPHHRPGHTVPVAAARHDLALPRRDLDTHWGPRSRGVPTGATGWLFTGRVELMRALIAAVTGGPGVTVVTGGAGSGKSAVLARLVTLTDPQFLDEHESAVAAVAADLRPPRGGVDVAVVATNKLHTEILAQICTALRVPAPDSAHPEPTTEERLAAWHAWLAARRHPVTIVVDALDEAAHPYDVLHDVLTRLDPGPGRRRVRLLVGVRSLAAGDTAATDPPAAATAALADATVEALHAHRLPVDQPPWWDQADVVACAADILRHTRGSPYRATAEATTAAVAHALGHHAGRSFLVAGIAASSLAHRDRPVAADDPDLLAALEDGLLGVFRDDLHRSLPDPDDRYRAVVLLRAVAFAHGAGLPWRDIWPLVAHAVDDNGGRYGDADIAWLLKSRLGAYLVTDTEDDTTVYRLHHDLLRTTLRERWHELLGPGDGDR